MGMMSDFNRGDLVLSNGLSRLYEVLEFVPLDKRWKVPGYRVVPLNMGDGDGYGHSVFMPETALKRAPMDWTPVLGGGVEERYAFAPYSNTWYRDLRKIPT